jgi:hypothetical protein
MKRKKGQNPVYLVTTISVYLGLVLVGASPQVLAQSSIGGDTQSRIFELASKTGSVFSKLKLRQEISDSDTAPFSTTGSGVVQVVRWCLFAAQDPAVRSDSLEQFSNEQVLTVSILPRASI